jgi:hypothetical protein
LTRDGSSSAFFKRSATLVVADLYGLAKTKTPRTVWLARIFAISLYSFGLAVNGDFSQIRGSCANAHPLPTAINI